MKKNKNTKSLEDSIVDGLDDINLPKDIDPKKIVTSLELILKQVFLNNGIDPENVKRTGSTLYVQDPLKYL